MAESLDRAADAVTDGVAVDWDALERGSPADNRNLIHQLRAIGALAEYSRENTSDPVTLRQWGALEIRGPIGTGAHGAVFRAWDCHLHRDVALKLLHRLSTDVNGAASREGRLLARVRHPNVVTVYGGASIAGQCGIWMELVEGVTLREHVRMRGALPEAEAIRIAVDVCRGLGALHHAGLLHRDINANNVMRDRSGRIVLMDLGSGADLGQPESFAGSPMYLAPELLNRGAASVASDIYAVGVLLFFLATARLPVKASSISELAAALSVADLARLSPRDGVSSAFCDVVNRALMREPADRFASAAAMEEALHRAVDVRRSGRPRFVTVALTAALCAGTVIGVTSAYQAGQSSARQVPVLIAAFENRTAEPHLDDAVEAALAYALADSPHLSVVNRQRVDDLLALMRLRDTPVTLQVAREISARDGHIPLLVTGSIDQEQGAFVLGASLIRAADNAVLARVQQTAGRLDDVGEAVKRVSSQLRASAGEAQNSIDSAGQDLDRVTTPSLAALWAYSRAMTAFNRGVFEEADALLADALRLDPDFASAHIWRAWTLTNLGRPAPEALAEAARALQLADRASERERYWITASYYDLNGDYRAAIPQLEALTNRYPDDMWGVRNLGRDYQILGRVDTMLSLYLALARARPNDFMVAALAAASVAEFRGAPAAQVHVAKATRLLQATGGRFPTTDAFGSFIAIYGFHELWRTGRVQQAASELGTPEIVDAARRDGTWGMVRYGAARLTLGQLTAADAAFAALEGVANRQLWRAIVALARGQRDEVTRVLRDYTGRDLAAVSLLVRVGDLDAAERQFERVAPLLPTTHVEWSRQEIALARRDPAALDAARAQGTPWLYSVPGVRAYLYSETLAESLRDTGDLDGAVRVLEEASRLRDRALTRATHNGYFYLRLRRLLAEVYRLQGRESQARTIDQELADFLRLAEPDDEIARHLKIRPQP